MKRRHILFLVLLGITLIIIPILYWLFCIHWTVGIIGLGITILITMKAILEDDDLCDI